MTTCPYCGVQHRWGLIREPIRDGEVRNGCRLPYDGMRMRCGKCGKLVVVAEQAEGTVTLGETAQPKWWQLWL